MGFGPVRTDFERALKNAQRKKMVYAHHAGTVAAARALADKIDAWDVIVQWALDDQRESGASRPKVPDNDNTSIPSFLKYMEALGLTVTADRAKEKQDAAVAAAARKVKGAQGVSKLEALQKGVGLRPA